MVFRSRKGVLGAVLLLVLAALLLSFWVNNKSNTIIGNNAQHWKENDHVVDVTFTHNLNEVNTSYISNVKVNPVEITVDGTIKVLAENNTGKSQDKIYFHLYANAFRDTDKLSGPVWNSVLGANPKPGWIDVHKVQVNGKQVDGIVKETILEVPLSEWKVNNKVEIQIDFHIQVPKNNMRFSYDDHIMWLGNWLPIRAMHDENGWNLDPYHPIGDPFYSDVANYQLAVEVPKGYQLASSGIEGDRYNSRTDGSRQYVVKAIKVRDFAMTIMDDNYRMLSDKVNNTEVRTWYLESDSPSTVKKLHKSANKSVAYFSKVFGDYPFEEYDVVRTGGFFGGMEYPGLIYIEGNLFENQDSAGISTIVHETAHQWWYGIVGNDEVEEPWLDESLTHYSMLQFLMAEYPDIADFLLQMTERGMSSSTEYEQKGVYVGSPVTKFSDWSSYGRLVYSKGAQMFYRLEQAIGTDRMNEALSAYFEQYKYKNASGEDLIGAFEKVLGSKARDYFNAWLNGKTTSFDN